MRIWTLTGGRRGNEVIVEGVARALIGKDNNAGDGDIRALCVALPRLWSWMPRARLAIHYAASDSMIAPPFPDIVLASGAQTIAHARYIRAASQGNAKGACFTVYLQDPRIAAKHFDFVWAHQHDRIVGDNVFKTHFSPHALDQAQLAQAADAWRDRLLPPHHKSKIGGKIGGKIGDKSRGKIIGVSIGGPNRAYAFTARDMQNIAHQLASLAADGHIVLVSLSRRTPVAHGDILRRTLAPYPHYVWGQTGDNPYCAILGLADHLLVSADSVNMIGEACITGKPVQILALTGGSAKFNRFHTAICAENYVRPFMGRLETWDVRPHNPTQRIADKIHQARLA